MKKCNRCGRWGLFTTLNKEGFCSACANQISLEKEHQKELEKLNQKRIEEYKRCQNMAMNDFKFFKLTYSDGESITEKRHKQLLADDSKYKTGYFQWYL